MKTILKYPINFHGHTEVRGPAPLRPLSAAMQNGQLVIWCAVDTEAEHEMVLDVYGVFTGEPAAVDNPRIDHHIATVQHAFGGQLLVSHIFAAGARLP